MKQTPIGISLLAAVMYSALAYSAAPEDITNNQRAWFDSVDINANGDYTDNPSNNSTITQWSDKSGSSNHVFATGSNRPRYRHNSLLVNRHAVDFDGRNDILIDNNDIWIGAVTQAESFVMITTDQIKNSTLFGSSDNGRNRLSTHLPWGNAFSYYDQGICCSAPTRMYGNIPISLSTGYFWHFIGSPSLQAVIRDGDTRLSDSGASTYNVSVNSKFALAGWPGSPGVNTHHGRVFEAIFYQAILNNAQRRIISSYLSAKWSKAFSVSADYLDVYTGDNSGNGNYDYFVGGIGQDGGQQQTGTSQGLTIQNDTFLNSDGKFVIAGVDYLLTAPTTGLSITDLPSNYVERSNRTWFVDTTGSGGLVNLTFDASEIGIPVDNGANYGLLYRAGTGGAFTEVATSSMSAGLISFSHLPADGVYSVGKLTDEVALTVLKTVDDTSPNIGDVVTFTITVANAGPDAAINASVEDIVPAGFANLAPVSTPAGTTFLITGNTIDWTGLSIAVAGSVSAVFTAEILSPQDL